MNPFRYAYDRHVETRRAAIRPADLAWRYNRRFRCWERPDDPRARAVFDRIDDRRQAAIEIAEEASDALDLTWHAYSVSPSLRPLSGAAGECRLLVIPTEQFWRIVEEAAA